MTKETYFFPRILLVFYFYLFLIIETLSVFSFLSRTVVFTFNLFFLIFVLYFYKEKISVLGRKLKKLVKIRTYQAIFIVLLLTFVQGFLSAPSTTDAMVYHIPRVMYWLQEHTVFQTGMYTKHDFMAPFADYILLHLYSITNSDRLLFLSQWIAYASSIYVSGLIVRQLGGLEKTIKKARLLIAFLPIAVMQSASTQIDMVSALFPLLCLYFSLEMREKITLQNSIMFGLSVGLGLMTKAPSVFFMTPAFGIIVMFLFVNKSRGIWYLITGGLLSVIIQLRYFLQNYILFGSIFGKHLTHIPGEELMLTNEKITISIIISNFIKNLMLHLPFPFFASRVQDLLITLHRFINLPINSFLNTCCDMEFKVASIIYPQEDIVVNPIHLILIIVTGIVFFNSNVRKKNKILFGLYLFLILSMISFGAFIKWQVYHSRFHISFFLIGTILSALVLDKIKIGKKIVDFAILLSGVLGLLLIILNVSRPYISYAPFYKYVKTYSPSLASMPVSFSAKSRREQYFNARWYWYKPYNQIIDLLGFTTNNDIIAIKLMDDFEYPLWMLLKSQNIKGKIVSEYQISQANVIITTAEKPVDYKDFETNCIKTEIEYGYICLSKTLKRPI